MISSAFYRSKINKLRTFDYCRSSLKSDLPSCSDLNKETSSKKEYQNFYRSFQDLWHFLTQYFWQGCHTNFLYDNFLKNAILILDSI